MYLLDTDICIYAIKKKPARVLHTLKKKSRLGIHVSSITVAELEYGAEKSAFPERNRVALIEFLSIFDILKFDERDAVEYGKIRARLEKKGTPIGALDLLIAAQALSRDLVLVSNNLKEFSRIEELRLENWAG
jgi:tRNA(fMet)-specific endonuclease VapC